MALWAISLCDPRCGAVLPFGMGHWARCAHLRIGRGSVSTRLTPN